MNSKLRFNWRACGDRLRLIRLALGITEADAAAAYCVTLKTYRRYEAGHKQRAADGWLRFCERFDISLDYYLTGSTHSLGRHLTVNRATKISILPAMTPHERQAVRKFGPTIGLHASQRLTHN